MKWYESDWISYRDCYQLPCGEYGETTFSIPASFVLNRWYKLCEPLEIGGTDKVANPDMATIDVAGRIDRNADRRFPE